MQTKKRLSLLFSFHELYTENGPKWNALYYMEISVRPFDSNNVLSITSLLGNLNTNVKHMYNAVLFNAMW